MVIDLDKIEVKEGDGKTYLKDDGEYIVTIKDFEKGNSAKKGTPYVKFSCVTDDNRWTNVSLYLTEGAEWKFKKFLTALGHPGTGRIDTDVTIPMCVDKRIKLICGHPETLDPVTGVKTTSQYLEVLDFMKA